MPNQAEILKQQFMQSLARPWKDILPGSRLDEILEEENITYRSRVYTPVITLWAMVSQVRSPRQKPAQCSKTHEHLADSGRC